MKNLSSGLIISLAIIDAL